MTDKVTDLTFLKGFCAGDPARMNKYIRFYLASIPENMDKIVTATAQSDYDMVARVIQFLKAHFQYMGMKQTRLYSDKIEDLITARRHLDQVPALVALLRADCQRSFEELSEL